MGVINNVPFFRVKMAIVKHLSMKLRTCVLPKNLLEHSCGYSKSCPDGLIGLFRTKVVTGHVGPAPKTIMYAERFTRDR